MRKIYYVVATIVSLLFIYYLIKFFPTISNKATKITEDSISESNTRFFRFKSTPENENLVKEFMKANTGFIKNPPAEISHENKSINNFYRLEEVFTDYEYYYSLKQQMCKILFDELPLLTNGTVELSKNELENYYNKNKTYLSKTWGIENLQNFKNFVNELAPLKDSKISSYELEKSYFFMKSSKVLNIRIKLNLENSNTIYLASQIKFYDDNGLQTLPKISFFGTSMGGMS